MANPPPPQILLVENNPDEVILMRRALKAINCQYELQVAEDGQVAIDYLSDSGEFAGKTHPDPSMILLDLNMPRKGGVEVLQWIRSQPSLATVPTIVLTSSSLEADKKRAYDAGANSYAQKPVSFENFRKLVAHLTSFWLRIDGERCPCETFRINSRSKVHMEYV